ncbi:MAG: hypothetical protein KIT83_04735 [Bryobacterales bacterium]|nr:hypothetical protein [Bryobacterales bacterium]
MLAISVLAYPYAVSLSTPAVGLYHDDGIYLITAKAIASGDGYRLMNLPGEPAQTKYPPMFAFVLALVLRVTPEFPANTFWLKVVPLFFALIWLYLSYHLLRAMGLASVIAAACVFAVASSPAIIFLSTSLLSETLFAALAMGTILFLERTHKNDSFNWTSVAIAAGLAVAVVNTRMIGLSLIVAIPLWLWLCQRKKWAVWFSVLAGVLVTPWIWWVATHRGVGYYTVAPYTNWHIFSPNVAPTLYQKFQVVLGNMLMSGNSASMLWRAPDAAVPFMALLFGGVLAVGGLICIRQRSLLSCFVLTYVGIAICWVWPPYRFLAVILPVLLWIALQVLPAKILTSGARGVAFGIVLLSVPMLTESYRSAYHASQHGVFSFGMVEAEPWSDVQNVTEWVRNNTPPSCLIVANLDPLYHLYTGRKALRGFEANPFGLFYASPLATPPTGIRWQTDLVAPENQPLVVVRSPDPNFAESPHVDAEIEARIRSGQLHLVYESGKFQVFRPHLDGERISP